LRAKSKDLTQTLESLRGLENYAKRRERRRSGADLARRELQRAPGIDERTGAAALGHGGEGHGSGEEGEKLPRESPGRGL